MRAPELIPCLCGFQQSCQRFRYCPQPGKSLSEGKVKKVDRSLTTMAVVLFDKNLEHDRS